MFARIVNYCVLSRVVAAILAFAGLSKMHEFSSVDYDQVSVVSLVLGIGEVLLAIWLACGLFPQWSRMVMLVFFLVLANVAFSQALATSDSCSCFGRLAVNPWIAFGLDISVVCLFLFLAPTESPKIIRLRMATFSVLAILAITSGIFLFATRWFSWGDSSDPQSPEARRLLAKVVDGISKNHSAYDSLEFDLSQVVLSPGQNEGTTVLKDAKGEISAIIRSSPRFENTFHYVLRGPNVRRDTKTGTGAGNIDSMYDGCEISYTPSGKRAVAREAGLSVGGTPFDPRCLGFDTPIVSVPDWIRRHQIKGVSPFADPDQEGVELRVIVKLERPKRVLHHEWVVRFSAHHNYLPVKIEEYYENGRRSRLGQFSYERLPTHSSWFLKRLKVEKWPTNPPKTKGADPEMPVNIFEYELPDAPRVNNSIPDSAFDFPLAEGVGFALSSKKLSYSKLATAKTFFDLFDQSYDKNEIAVRRSYWPYVLLLDLSLLAIALIARKRVSV